jgi:hypothetical protein
MAESQEGPGPGTTVIAGDMDSGEAPDWGRLLDAAGFIAGVLLIAICADILTSGRLISRRLQGRNPGDPAAD